MALSHIVYRVFILLRLGKDNLFGLLFFDKTQIITL